jgi:hypothetical protein
MELTLPMPERNYRTTKASQYDKIIKENLETTLPVIIRDVLGLDILVSEELPDDVQHTKERKPDALKKVTDIEGNTYILQLEFQLKDEKEMVYRMAEYYIMLLRRYRLPIKQYVIFLKDSNPRMKTVLDTEDLKFNFRLIQIAEINYNLFLRSNDPKIKMLGILANFGNEDTYKVVKAIVDDIHSVTNGDFAQNRNFKQLRVFVHLRSNIEQQFIKAMDSISSFFKEENDIYYRRGQSKGEEKKSRVVVENLIVKLGLTDEQAAEVAEVSLDYVKTLRAELKK